MKGRATTYQRLQQCIDVDLKGSWGRYCYCFSSSVDLWLVFLLSFHPIFLILDFRLLLYFSCPWRVGADRITIFTDQVEGIGRIAKFCIPVFRLLFQGYNVLRLGLQNVPVRAVFCVLKEYF